MKAKINFEDKFNITSHIVFDKFRITVSIDNETDRKYMRQYIFKYNFNITIIEEVTSEIIYANVKYSHYCNNDIEFILKYYIRSYGIKNFKEISFESNYLTDYISPIDYFWFNKRKGIQNQDLLYKSIDILDFNFYLEDIRIKSSISVGNILKDGIRSDLKLNTILNFQLNKISNLDISFQIFDIVLKFLQMMSYRKNVSFNKIILKGIDDNEKNKIGYLYANIESNDVISSSSYNASFLLTNNHISDIFQTLVDDKCFYVKHLPNKYDDLFDIDVIRYFLIFSAFESEYNKIYDNTKNHKDSSLKGIKKILLNKINEINCDYFNENEKKCLLDAKSVIGNIGKRVKTIEKIINSLQKYKKCIEGTLEYKYLDYDDLFSYAKKVCDIRNDIVHENYDTQFDQFQIFDIKILEYLTYAMFLSRCKFNDNEINHIIKKVFWGYSVSYLMIKK
ncbi:hypothetical protein KHQ81_10840 [Mycoplasmatota bacterium]|nr:hypothetical protein KHQ81_10840 [Mycoplasmatota bacterium]